MKAATATALTLAATLLFTVARAESIFQFDVWMQRTEKRMLSVQRNLKSGNADAAIADATELRELYQKMEDFFAHRDDAIDAVKQSHDGVALLGRVIDSTTVHDYDAALTSAISVSKACRDCHNQYKPLY
jgi:hypothetical protein